MGIASSKDQNMASHGAFTPSQMQIISNSRLPGATNQTLDHDALNQQSSKGNIFKRSVPGYADPVMAKLMRESEI